MELSKNQQESINLYLQGKLEEKALEDFLQELNENPEMEKELESQKALAEGIEFFGNQRLRQRLQKISKETKEKTITAQPPVAKRRALWPALAIAATVAIVWIVCFSPIFQNRTPATLAEQFYTPSTLTITRNTELDKQLAEAEKLYNNKEYAAAIPLLQAVLKNKEPNSNIQLALGNALLLTGKPSEAIQSFQNIINNKDELYSDQAKWYLALTCLRTGSLAKGKSMLKELSDDQDADFHSDAKELLELLKD